MTAAWPVSPWLVPAVYAAMSLVTFFAYGLDKRAARRGTRRIPEATLHVLSLLGGWPGALVAHGLLRHKTRKQPFRAVFWATVAANLGLLAALVWAYLVAP